jgi:hypothetical protein
VPTRQWGGAGAIVSEWNTVFGGETHDMASVRCRWSRRGAFQSRGAPDPTPHDGAPALGDGRPAALARMTACRHLSIISVTPLLQPSRS